MSSTVEGPCPLCGTTAVFDTEDSFNRWHFACPTCGDFLVIGRAIRELEREPYKAKQIAKALSGAHAPARIEFTPPFDFEVFFDSPHSPQTTLRF
jgi:predicted RNA-binding Zn-ribbon protein involved in translation (DUF1610 family)